MKNRKSIRIRPSHRGLLHRELDVAEGKEIPEAKLKKAEASADLPIRRRAQFADNAKKFRHSGSDHGNDGQKGRGKTKAGKANRPEKRGRSIDARRPGAATGVKDGAFAPEDKGHKLPGQQGHYRYQ